MGGLAFNILQAEWFIKTQTCLRICNSSIIIIILIIITINIVEVHVNWNFQQKNLNKNVFVNTVSVKNVF